MTSLRELLDGPPFRERANAAKCEDTDLTIPSFPPKTPWHESLSHPSSCFPSHPTGQRRDGRGNPHGAKPAHERYVFVCLAWGWEVDQWMMGKGPPPPKQTHTTNHTHSRRRTPVSSTRSWCQQERGRRNDVRRGGAAPEAKAEAAGGGVHWPERRGGGGERRGGRRGGL